MMNYSNKLTIIITARKGSKRILNKNLQKINGISLIENTIQFAEQFNVPIILSTDYSKTDLTLNRNYRNLEIRKRPLRLCSDTITSDDVLKDVIEHKNLDGLLLLLQPTSPFRKSSHISNALEKMNNTDIDLILSGTEFSEDLWKQNNDGILTRIFKDETRRQQTRPVKIIENGNFYLFRAKKFMKNGCQLIRLNCSTEIIEFPYNIDINSEKDLLLTRLISTAWNF